MGDLYLIYVNKIGSNWKGEHIYEFLFSDSIDHDWDEVWYEHTVNSYDELTPSTHFIQKVGTLQTDELSLDLVQESGVFCVYNAVEDIIALAWERYEEDEDDYEGQRIVFRFGESIKSVEDKLYELDLILNYEGKIKTNG